MTTTPKSAAREPVSARGGTEMKEFEQRALLGSASIAAIMAAVMAGPQAAQAEGATPAASQGAQVEEVVVTAQKRSENLQTVPISVEVVNRQTLVTQNLNSLQD